MSETCGGCVYDGVPLPGVTVDTVEHLGIDRLRITGPMVAAGYFDDPDLTAAHFSDGAYLPTITGPSPTGSSRSWVAWMM